MQLFAIAIQCFYCTYSLRLTRSLQHSYEITWDYTEKLWQPIDFDSPDVNIFDNLDVHFDPEVLRRLDSTPRFFGS